MQCPNCGSYSVQSRGARNGKNRYQCQNNSCSQRWFSVSDGNNQEVNFEAPKILLMDIETSTILTEVFDTGNQYVGKKNIRESWYMLSWSAQWLNDDEVFGDVVSSKEAKNRNDKRITSLLWKLVDECDWLITYNGDGFDIPRINRRFLENGLMRPSFYTSIDLYKTIKRVFDFESNAMDFVAERLKLERKKQNGGWELWQAASRGEQSALTEMITYGLGDIPPMQEMYYEIRPWIYNHPNIGLYNVNETDAQCQYCGSTDISPKDRLVPVGLNLYRSFRCNDCYGIGRYKDGQLSKEKRKTMTRSIRY